MSTSESAKTFLHLKEEDYWSTIYKLSEGELYKQHARVSRKKVASTVGVVVGLVEVPITFGMSLLFTPIHARRMNVNTRKKELIETRLLELNRSGYSLKKRDVMIPLTIAALSMGVIAGADLILEYGLDTVGEIAKTQTAAAGAAATQTAGETAATHAAGTTATQTAGEAAATHAAGTTATQTTGEAAATHAAGTTATQTAGEAAATQATGTTEEAVKGATKAAAREALDAGMEHAVKRSDLPKKD